MTKLRLIIGSADPNRPRRPTLQSDKDRNARYKSLLRQLSEIGMKKVEAVHKQMMSPPDGTDPDLPALALEFERAAGAVMQAIALDTRLNEEERRGVPLKSPAVSARISGRIDKAQHRLEKLIRAKSKKIGDDAEFEDFLDQVCDRIEDLDF